MPDHIPSNLSPAFNVCNSYENQAVPFLGHFKINWHRTHAFSQTTLLLVGVAFAFFMKLPLVLIGIMGFANIHMIIHFAQEKREFFPFFDKLEVNWNRLQFFSHSTFVLSGIAFAFFMHLTPIMIGLTAYGIAQAFLYIKEEKNIEVPFLDQIDIKWQSVQFKANCLLFVSGIAATYLLQMPFLLIGLAGFGLTQRILHETNSDSLSKKVQLHWDKIALVENGATLLGGFTLAAYLGFPIIMLGLSIYGMTQMFFFQLAHKTPFNYALQERKVQFLDGKEIKLETNIHELEIQNDKLMQSLVAMKVDEALTKEKVRKLKEQESQLKEVKKTYQDLKEKQVNLEGKIEQLEKNRAVLLKKDTAIVTIKKDRSKLQNEVQELKHQIDILRLKKDTKDQNLQRIQAEELVLKEKIQERERTLAKIPEELEDLEEQRDELRVFQATILETCKEKLKFVQACSEETIAMMSQKVDDYAQTLKIMREETNNAKLAIVSTENDSFRKQSGVMVEDLEKTRELLKEFAEELIEEREKQQKWQAMIEKMLANEPDVRGNRGKRLSVQLTNTRDSQKRIRGNSLSSTDLKALEDDAQMQMAKSGSTTTPLTRNSLTRQQAKDLEKNETALKRNRASSLASSSRANRERGSLPIEFLTNEKGGSSSKSSSHRREPSKDTLELLRKSETVTSKPLTLIHTDPNEIQKIEGLIKKEKKKDATFYGTG